jgi:hypothetical protein
VSPTTGLTHPDLKSERKPALSTPLLPSLIVHPDGTRREAKLTPEQHTRLYLKVLHGDRDAGLIEVAYARRRRGEKPTWESRSKTERYPHVRDTESIVALVAAGRAAHKEVCLGVVLRTEPRGTREAAGDSHLLWIDIDKPGELHRLWAWPSPPHLIVSSGRGVHAFLRLAGALPARPLEREYLERANLRLGYQLAGDSQVRHRNCLLRAPGSINHKNGNWCYVLFADFQRPPYDVKRLVGALPEPPAEFLGRPIRRRPPNRPPPFAANLHDHDPARCIAPRDYFTVLARRNPGEYRVIQCPNPAHKGGEERTPSCEVFDTPQEGWHCWGCGAGGSIYDLAGVMLGVGWGPAITRQAMRDIVGPHVERAFNLEPYRQRMDRHRREKRRHARRPASGRRAGNQPATASEPVGVRPRQ